MPRRAGASARGIPGSASSARDTRPRCCRSLSPDGFPFAVRVPVRVDAAARWIRIEGEPAGIPFSTGLACLTAHEHGEQFTWQQNFQVRGDLVFVDGVWALIPHKVIGGFEIPRSRFAVLRANAAKARRFRRTAKRELARRGG